MDNQNKKEMSTVAKIGIAALVLLVLVVVVVNMTGGKHESRAEKAFKEAFLAQNAITDEFYNAHPEEKKLRELSSSDSATVLNAQIVQAGETGNKLLNLIVPKVALEAETEKAGSTYKTALSFNLKGRELASGEIFLNDGKLILSMPGAWQENYSLEPESAAVKEFLRNVYLMNLKNADTMGRNASSYFLTSLKFAQYEENENGTVSFTIAEDRLSKALSFVKNLIGEKLDSSEAFPIDADSVKIKNVKGNVSFKEDDSLNDSILSCDVEFSLKGRSDKVNTAKFTAGMSVANGLEVFAEIDFGGESSVSISSVRTSDENGYDLTVTGYIASALDKNAVEIHKIFPSGEEADRLVSLKYLKQTDGTVKGCEVQSAGRASYENAEGGEKVMINSPETYILLLNKEGKMVPMVKLDAKYQVSPLAAEIVVPEAKDIASLTDEEISDIKMETVKLLSANALSLVLGK